MYINKCQIMGNLTRDPELKALPSGMKVATFSMATNRTWKDANGAKQEAVEYHNVVTFGKSAELISQYMKKGNSLYVEGRLQTRSWEKEGQKQYRTEIVVDNFQFGPKQGGTAVQTQSTHIENPTPGQTVATEVEEIDTVEYPTEDDINIEDIPF